MTAIEMQDFVNRAPWFLPLVIVGAIWSVAVVAPPGGTFQIAPWAESATNR